MDVRMLPRRRTMRRRKRKKKRKEGVHTGFEVSHPWIYFTHQRLSTYPLALAPHQRRAQLVIKMISVARWPGVQYRQVV